MEETSLKLHKCKNYTNRRKYKETCKNKWGVDNYFKTAEYLIPRIFRDKQDHIKRLNKKLKNGYCMNYNHKNNTIHYHCNLCNKDYICNHATFLTRIGRNQNPCPQCFKRQAGSSGEYELRQYIRSIFKGLVLYNDRKTINPLELDVYLPDLKIAFEFDGTYWHMDSRIYKATDFNINKQKCAKDIWDYDKNKDKIAENNGIKIVRIKEIDWIKSKDKEKIKIRKILENAK